MTEQPKMKTVAVINGKGGSGKTTIATNLAALYTAQGKRTAIMDYDPQGSSLQWLRLREPEQTVIEGIDASRSRTGMTRAWQLSVPPGTERLIIDAPAGCRSMVLQEIVRRSSVVVVPVVPSPIDIHATADFIRDLLLVGHIRQVGVPVGVIANRLRPSVPLYEPLARFLSSLKIPVVGTLTDTDNYIIAAEAGKGIYELDSEHVERELREWKSVADWLEDPKKAPSKAGGRPQLNVVSTANAG